MFKEIKQGVLFTLVTMVLLGGGYNVLLWGIGQWRFAAQAEGSLIRRADGTVVGSRLIAQKFTRPEYFQPRPSGVDYNAASTGGTNYGPSNPDHLKAVQERLDAVMKQEGVAASQVPSEMVTASGAGMDPHIPPAAAEMQAARVRRARGVAGGSRPRTDSSAHRSRRRSGSLGRARVNVLELNLALDDDRLGRPRTRTREDTTCLNMLAGSRSGTPAIIRQAIDRLRPEAGSADTGQEPGDVHRRGRQPLDDDRLHPGARQRQRPPAVHGTGGVLALVHGPVRELRRGDGRGPRQGAGGYAAEDANRNGRSQARGRRPHGSRAGGAACARTTWSWSRPANSFPADGEIIDGVASVDESAITGESAPVIRESGGDRSAVTGGTRVISDWIKVRVTSDPGHTFLDRMIALVEGAERQKTPNEIALNDSAGRADARVPARRRDAAAVCVLRRNRDSDSRADRAAGVPDSDDDRRADFGDRHRRHGSTGAAQRAGDVGPRGRSRRRRQHAAARQDRHDHPRQPPGDRVPAGAGRQRARAGGCRAASIAGRRNAGGPLDCRAGEGEILDMRGRELADKDATFVPFTAQTRMSGVNIGGREIRKGAADAITKYIAASGGTMPARAAADRRAHRPCRRHAAASSPTQPRASVWSTSRTSSRAACASASPHCARWASRR